MKIITRAVIDGIIASIHTPGSSLTMSPEAAFSEDIIRELAELRSGLGPNTSRLSNIRVLLGSTFRTYIKEVCLAKPDGAVVETYKLNFGNMQAEVKVLQHNHLYNGLKPIPLVDTALAHNAMLSNLGQSCNDAGADTDEIVTAQDLFTRVFILYSQGNRYSVDSDRGFWEVIYHDPKGNTQVKLSLELL